MKEILKNLVASTPLLLAVAVGYIAAPIVYVSKQLSNLGIYTHEKLETTLGKQITQKRQEIKAKMAAMMELQARMQAASTEDSALASVVKTNGKTTVTGGNVFVLGKKSEDSGNKT